jgi:hypothetical protein
MSTSQTCSSARAKTSGARDRSSCPVSRPAKNARADQAGMTESPEALQMDLIFSSAMRSPSQSLAHIVGYENSGCRRSGAMNCCGSRRISGSRAPNGRREGAAGVGCQHSRHPHAALASRQTSWVSCSTGPAEFPPAQQFDALFAPRDHPSSRGTIPRYLHCRWERKRPDHLQSALWRIDPASGCLPSRALTFVRFQSGSS